MPVDVICVRIIAGISVNVSPKEIYVLLYQSDFILFTEMVTNPYLIFGIWPNKLSISFSV